MANIMNIQYGSKTYQLPKSLVTNEEFVKEIVSANVWNNKLRKSDKMNLLKFLPDFPENDTFEKKETLKKLFLGKHINFENQIKTFVRLAKEGDFNSSIKSQKGLDLLLAERNRKITLFKRRLKDLQKIINTKKSLSIEISEEEEKCMEEFQFVLSHDDPLSDIVDLRFEKIMKKITGDPDELKKSELCAEYLANESLDYKSLSLCDVINRCQNDNDAVIEESVVNCNSTNNPCGPMTRKRRQLQNGFGNTLNKYAKFNDSSDSQSESSDDCRSNEDNSEESVSSDTDSVGSAGAPIAPTISKSTSVTDNHKRIRLNRHERREFRCPQDDFSDYFSLLQRLFAGAHQQKLTTHQIEDRIRHWHIVNKRNIGDSFNRWAILSPDWVCLAVPALTYLSLGDSPIVEHRKKSQIWRWKLEIDSQTLRKLFNDWHQLSNGTSPGNSGPIVPVSHDCEQIPPPLFQTEWRVRPSTAEERIRFQIQERKRFMRPWRGFMYNTHGYNCVVAPIRGCLPGRDYSNVKARGHPLLVNERPPHVNIVEIVRDAVARLPNGEGSRADIVSLAMDSAFWSSAGPGSEKSISQCISSALDRLQGEGCDPSVKYNARLKLWFYRHRNKALEELEQLHYQQQQQQHQQQPHGPEDSRRSRAARPSSSGGSTTALLCGQLVHLAPPGPGPATHSQSRFNQIQSFQQFSQAVHHARDLSLMHQHHTQHAPHHQQPVLVSRQHLAVAAAAASQQQQHQQQQQLLLSAAAVAGGNAAAIGLSSNSGHTSHNSHPGRLIAAPPPSAQDFYNQSHHFYY